MKKFYVYEHFRSDTNECFYVGKGTGSRAFQKKNNRNAHYMRIIDKLAASNHEVTIVIIRSDMTEDEALLFEMERIAFWREKNVALCNMTAGGDGVRTPSPETVEKMKIASSRRWSDPAKRLEAARKTKEALKDPALRDRIASKLIGRKMPLEQRQKISLALSGKKRPKASIRMSREGNPFWGKSHSPEVLEKIAQKKRGTKLSEETRAKMKQAQRFRREREREHASARQS